MATIINATDVVVKVNGEVVGCAQSADFTVTREMDEATCAASGGWKQVSPGQKSWSGSFAAVMREFTTAEAATNVSFDAIFDMLDEGTEVEIEFSKANATGSRYGGNAFISEVKQSNPEKGTVTWSANYTGNGAFARLA